MATKKWSVDPVHSEIQFKVKHLMITTVTGSFEKFDITAETEENDFTTGTVRFSADIDSVTTGNPDRDTHLKSGEFFDAPAYPQMTFVSTRAEKESDDEFVLHGDLTIRGTTKSVALKVEFGGVVKDPYGQTKAGFTLNGKIKRKEFGLSWDAVTEAGGVVVSDEVRIACEVQLVQQ